MIRLLGKNNPSWKGGQIKKTCCKCGVAFLVYPYRKNAKFCSRKCANRVTLNRKGLRSGKDFVCLICGKSFYRHPSCIRKGITKFCSSRCWGLRKKQIIKDDPTKNIVWKGGITPELTRIRHSEEYANWRRSVFERDNYTCRFCGRRGVEIQADHIKPFAYYPELRFIVENGRTLCVECHKGTGTYLIHLSKDAIFQKELEPLLSYVPTVKENK